jgi:hypothetical protein
MLTKIFLIIPLLLLSACDITGLERTRDNRSSSVTVNESRGEHLYLDNDGWSWLVDRYGSVIDGPFDIGNQQPVGTPLPSEPNPPPPTLDHPKENL